MTAIHVLRAGLFGIALLGVIATQGCTTTSSQAGGSTGDQKAALVDNHTKELLLMMDRDQNGKVSKQEFMAFMSGEFDRLDTDKNGDLDPVELNQLHYGRGIGVPR